MLGKMRFDGALVRKQFEEINLRKVIEESNRGMQFGDAFDRYTGNGDFEVIYHEKQTD